MTETYAAAEQELQFAVDGDRLTFALAGEALHEAVVQPLPGDADQWLIAGMHEYLVVRDFPASTAFEQFAFALQEGQGAACGLQPIQRVVSYWDGERCRGYCLYRAGSADVLRDAFLWLGLPPASIYPVAHVADE